MSKEQLKPGPQWLDALEDDEPTQVRRWRATEARKAGLTVAEAERFARGTEDTERLRKAASQGAPHDLLVDIFLDP